GVTLIYALVLQPEEVARLRADALGALTYTSNWRFIAQGQSYFETFMRPSAFPHLWSLALEEPFYLVFPLLLLAALPLTTNPRFVFFLLAAGAIGSSLEMALLSDAGRNVARLYYGADTRAAGLLIGAALALALRTRTARDGAGFPSKTEAAA